MDDFLNPSFMSALPYFTQVEPRDEESEIEGRGVRIEKESLIGMK
jgi:hypothetical protein